MEQGIKDHTIVITGGARGIGLAHAHYCAAQGANVVIVDSGSDLDGTGGDSRLAHGAAREIARAGGGSVCSAAIDVRSEGAFAEVLELALGMHGRLDAVILNAGMHTEKRLLNLDSGDLEMSLGYLVAAFRWTQQAIAYWSTRQAAGALLLTTSSRAWHGRAEQAHLSAADAAVLALVRSAAAELRQKPIRINAIAPFALSRQTRRWPESQHVDPHAISADYAAPLAAFLVSPSAKAVSGEVLSQSGARIYAIRPAQTPGVFLPELPVNLADMATLVKEALAQ
ncbi:MAG: SDR family oxidoreductase [Myxococcales bacterium]|nr:SDR family oxidoreductase [Myxococcales bacterium]MCB9708744.1 SDR family oxidoreductase [Myxococcales bacterium]